MTLVGGFDIGEASDLTWASEAFVGYRMTDLLTLWAGYRYLSIDRDFSTRLGPGELDMSFQGPTLGLGFRF